MRNAWLLVVLTAACSSKENKAVCQKASTRYLSCVAEVLGPEMAQMAKSGPDGTAACARDDKTVAMYKKCLPSATCNEFMDCLTDYASGTQPKVSTNKPRKEQCAEHVAHGMRGIANQIMMLGELKKRSNEDKSTAQACLFDESKPWDDCLSPPEIAEGKRYAAKRQADCEAWDDSLASCVLKLPGATGCNEDEFPLWDLPVELGAAGPAIAWTSTVTDKDDYDDGAQLAWAPNNTLIVHDDSGLRALRGDTAIWQRQLTEVDDKFALAGNFIVIRNTAMERGLFVIDATTGKDVGTALAGVPLERHGAVGDKVMVQTDSDELWEVNPGMCKGVKPSKACATKLGQLVTDDTVYSTRVSGFGTDVLMTSSTGIHLADRKAVTKIAQTLDDAESIVPTTDGVAVIYSQRIDLLTFAGCKRGDSCVTASHKMSWVNSVEPTALPGGAIAFNDHGIAEKTTLIEASGKGWTFDTNARGPVAADADLVYTISFGRAANEKTYLLAMRRADGTAAWHTELPGAAFDANQIGIALKGTMLAVRIGDKLYAITLVTKT